MDRREEVRQRVARFVGAEPDEIAFVANTSSGMNLIVDLLEGEGPVLSDELEFPAVTLPWIHRAVNVHFMPAVEGVLRIESFAASQAPRAATICISQSLAISGGVAVNDPIGILPRLSIHPLFSSLRRNRTLPKPCPRGISAEHHRVVACR